MLNTSVHHEMVCPLKTNLEMAERLLKRLNEPDLMEMVLTILASSHLVLLHTNDLLDQRIIQNGTFQP